MKIPVYQIDAFSREPFGGNPAAVCPLERWLDDALLQSIAAENNLSETAFYVPAGDRFELRWFTPAAEVDLCGHATLATGHLILSELSPDRAEVTFETREAGELSVARAGGRLRMTLPSRPPAAIEPPAGLVEAIGVTPLAVLRATKTTAVLESEAAVAAVVPDLRWIAANIDDGLIITARGDKDVAGRGQQAPTRSDSNVDFVSRFFAPAYGIDEDPVTGSAHCELAPYWAGELGTNRLDARQISARGGDVTCEVDGDRVHLIGDAVTVLRGELDLG